MDNDTFECEECGMQMDAPQMAFNYCPGCGTLGAHWQYLCNGLLTLYERDGRLQEALTLFRKSAHVDAARAALISLETELKRLGNTQSFGNQLVDDVLGFDFDKKTQQVTRPPKVAINDLASPSDRNEHEGVRLLIAGMFRGIRNSLMHNHVRFNPVHALSVVVMTDLLLDVLKNGSILKERTCVWRRVDSGHAKDPV